MTSRMSNERSSSTNHVEREQEAVVDKNHAFSHVKGVKGIAQEIEVRTSYEQGNSDEELAKRAIHSLGWNVSIPDNKVQVKVQQGWVTLTGEVRGAHKAQVGLNPAGRPAETFPAYCRPMAHSTSHVRRTRPI